MQTHFCAASSGACPPAPSSAPRQRSRLAVRQPLKCAASATARCSPHAQSARRQAAPLSPPCHATAAPDGPGAAPCAGGAWTAGALVRGSGRHCAGRGQAPARAWCRWGGVREGSAVGRSLRSIRPPLAPALRAAKSGRPSALSPSPPGEFQGVGPARRLARPTRQSALLSPAWQRSADEASRWVAMPALRGCQPLLPHGGTIPPYPPRARIPRGQKDAGKEIPNTAPTGSCLPTGRHARAVQGRRATWGCLASPGEVVGGGPSLRPHVIARQDLATRGPAGTGGAPAGRGGAPAGGGRLRPAVGKACALPWLGLVRGGKPAFTGRANPLRGGGARGRGAHRRRPAIAAPMRVGVRGEAVDHFLRPFAVHGHTHQAAVSVKYCPKTSVLGDLHGRCPPQAGAPGSRPAPTAPLLAFAVRVIRKAVGPPRAALIAAQLHRHLVQGT